MGFASVGGGGVGSTFGSVVAKAVKPKSAGSSVGRGVGRGVSKVVRRRSSSGGSSSSSRRRYGGGSSGRSSGGSSRNSGGGGGGGRSSAPKAPSAPSLASFLAGDATYQSVVRGGKRSLADLISELGRRRGEATTQYNQTLGSMERDRTQQLADLRDEFASRGLIQSGLFGEEQGRFQSQFAEQQTALKQQQTALLADLLSQQKNAQRENDLALEAARQEALQRRAAKYKLG